MNTVSPGPVQTDAGSLGRRGRNRVARASGIDAENVVAHQAADSSTGRFTYPRRSPTSCLLLASGRAGNVTGSDFTIDGGLVKTL